MINQFSRTQMLLGEENMQKLRQSKVAVFGIGGVGSFVVEGLIRAGIENFILIDNDVVSLTNINRQIIATMTTIGKNKVDVMEERILSINPSAKVEKHKEFFLDNTKSKIIDKSIDYVIDCVDTITAKIEIAKTCQGLNIPVISSMGTGNKLNPQLFEICDVFQTKICPLAKVMRRELKKHGVEKLKVIYSKEEPIKVFQTNDENFDTKKLIPGSISFVPSVAGLMIAGEVVKDLIKSELKNERN